MAYSYTDRILMTDRSISNWALSNQTVNLSSLSHNMDTVDMLTKEDVDDIIKDLIAKLSQTPILKHQCHSCGGTIEMDADNHLFRCPYCGSAYAIGTAMVHS